MVETKYRYDFECEVSTINGNLEIISYTVIKNGRNIVLEEDPPPIFRSVIFDIMQEYNYYRGQILIEHTISYIHFESPEECDLVCIDVAILEPEHRIDTERAIVPSKYYYMIHYVTLLPKLRTSCPKKVDKKGSDWLYSPAKRVRLIMCCAAHHSFAIDS